MPERVRITTPRGLRLRDSARDGATIRVLERGAEVEVLGRETWLRVRASDSSVGFVLADYTEPIAAPPRAAAAAAAPGAEIISFEHPSFRGESLRIDRDFESSALAVAALAQTHDVKLHVTSGLREPQVPVAGAVVTPAKLSNHHVGHAFDMNLLLDGELIDSRRLARVTELPQRARAFLLDVRTSPPLRWGGDFSVPDPVHIDDGLNIRDPGAFQAKVRQIWGG
jgi:hypothetical protein